MNKIKLVIWFLVSVLTFTAVLSVQKNNIYFDEWNKEEKTLYGFVIGIFVASFVYNAIDLIFFKKR